MFFLFFLFGLWVSQYKVIKPNLWRGPQYSSGWSSSAEHSKHMRCSPGTAASCSYDQALNRRSLPQRSGSCSLSHWARPSECPQARRRPSRPDGSDCEIQWLCVSFWIMKEKIKKGNNSTSKFDSTGSLKLCGILNSILWKSNWFPINWKKTACKSASSWENMFLPYTNNKGADQPAHPCSLISTFVVHYLDSKILILPISKIWRL